MLPRLLAVLATLVCGGEGGRVIGSSVHGFRPTEGPIDVGNAVASSTTEGGRIISDSRRGQCSGGSLSARALCVRARGGSMADGQGPTDYLSTLQDQSQPWWIDGKKNAKRKSSGSGGGFFAAEKGKQRRVGRTSARGVGSNSVASTSASATSSFRTGSLAAGDEPLSPGGWAALLVFPLVLLAGKLQDNAADGGGGGGIFPRARPIKAKPAAAAKKPKKPAPARVAKTAKKKAPAVPKKTAKPKPKVKPLPTKKVGPPPAVAKRGSGGAGGSGVLGRVVGKLIPDNPYLRALGIIALAVLGSGGLHALTTNNLLRAAWPITLVDPWQVLTATAWAINMRATSAVGRLDGRGRASGPRPVRFFTPAGWAFAIWAPIFLGEAIFVAFQLMPLPSIRGSWWLSDISPWFAGAMLFQTLWCFSFRPWARDNGLLWLPTLLLGGVAVTLGGLHGVLREAWFANDMTILQYIVIHVPLSLHFGWISCATLVNLNGYLASVARLSNGFKLGASLLTVVVAAVLGVGITLLREDAIYAAVVAWALWAVGSPAGWDELRGRVDPGAIRAQQGVAKAGAVVAAAAAGSLVGLSLKDAIVGAGGGEYNEDY